MKSIILALVSASIITPAFAQNAPVAAPSASPSVVMPAPTPVFQNQATDSAWLRSGTPVALKMAEALSTEKKKLRVGQRFQLEVAEAVIVNGQTVIPAGSPATGEVTDVRNKGMWGKSGKINARVLSVRVGDRTIRMAGQLDDKGTAGGIGAVAVSALVFLPAGFFMTGTSARIPMGAPVKAFIDEDVQLAFSSAVAPLTVATTAPTPAAPATTAVATTVATAAPAANPTPPVATTVAAQPAAATPVVAKADK